MSRVEELTKGTVPGVWQPPVSRPPRGPGDRHRNPCLTDFLAGTALVTLLAGCTIPASPHYEVAATAATTRAAHSPYSALALATADRVAARRTAGEAMRAYARPGLSARAWWAGLRPYLSADAQLAYAGTDPSTIPVTGVSGGARLTPASGPALARVAVPTSTGTYLLLLTRSVHRRDWLVTRIVAPERVE